MHSVVVHPESAHACVSRVWSNSRLPNSCGLIVSLFSVSLSWCPNLVGLHFFLYSLASRSSIISFIHFDSIILSLALARDDFLFCSGLLFLFDAISRSLLLLALGITLLIDAPLLSVAADPLLSALLLRIAVSVLCVVSTLFSSSVGISLSVGIFRMSPTLVVGITFLFSSIRDSSVDTPLPLWLVEKLLCSIIFLSVAVLRCETV